MRLLYAVYFFWIADWGEKATKVFWRFPFNKTSGLKFRTFCVSSGGKDTFLLHRPDPGYRAFRAFAHANTNTTIKINRNRYRNGKLIHPIVLNSSTSIVQRGFIKKISVLFYTHKWRPDFDRSSPVYAIVSNNFGNISVQRSIPK